MSKMTVCLSRSRTFVSMKGKISRLFHDDKLSKFSYWKTCYKNENNKVFEWFLDVGEIVEPVIGKIAQVKGSTSMPLQYLDLGCGLSDLSLHLLIHSPRPMCAVMVDFVSEALQYQRERFMEHKHMIQSAPESVQHLVCADVLQLPLKDKRFDIVMDKGTMDAVMKDKVQGHFRSGLMMSEVIRVLAPGGQYLQVSDEDPDTRQLLLESLSNGNQISFESDEKRSHKLSSWKFEIIPSRSGSEYFLYWAENLQDI